MKTGAKIAIGCGVAALLALVLVGAAVFGTAWWAKHKLDEATGGLERVAEVQQQIERYQEQADRNTFTRPPDGVLAEARLLKFLAVRRDVFTVYERYKTQLEALAKREKADLAAIGSGVQMINELRLAQAQAQAREGLSSDEYRFLVEQVYKTAWAANVAEQSGGAQPSEAARDALGRTSEELRRQLDNPELSEDARRQLEEALAHLDEQAGAAQRAAAELDVPPANLALFRKHAEEIRRYAMTGLEWVGL